MILKSLTALSIVLSLVMFVLLINARDEINIMQEELDEAMACLYSIEEHIDFTNGKFNAGPFGISICDVDPLNQACPCSEVFQF